jgi:hypothetical protein
MHAIYIDREIKYSYYCTEKILECQIAYRQLKLRTVTCIKNRVLQRKDSMLGITECVMEIEPSWVFGVN